MGNYYGGDDFFFIIHPLRQLNTPNMNHIWCMFEINGVWTSKHEPYMVHVCPYMALIIVLFLLHLRIDFFKYMQKKFNMKLRRYRGLFWGGFFEREGGKENKKKMMHSSDLTITDA